MVAVRFMDREQWRVRRGAAIRDVSDPVHQGGAFFAFSRSPLLVTCARPEDRMSTRLDYNAVAPEGLQALGGVYQYVKSCGLPQQLVELAFLRTSQINGCAFCIDMHSRDLLKQGMAIETLVLVSVWREAKALFSREEQAALALAESVTRVSVTGIPDADYDLAAAVFDDKRLVDLMLAISLMNAYNRMAIGFRSAPAAVGGAPD